jgi:polygalacturonase
VTVDSVTTADATNPNTDGCDLESCDHVVIKGCVFAAGDDCLAIKSGRDADGRRVDIPCQNVVVMRCRLEGPAGGIAFGSEMTGGIRNVYLFDVGTFGASVQHMLYVKSNTRRGGYAMNLNFDSVWADHVTGAWAFAQMDYDGQTGIFPPGFADWTITRATGDFDLLIFQLSGLVGDPVRHVRVVDSQFTHALLPFGLFNHVDALEFERVTVNGREL